MMVLRNIGNSYAFSLVHGDKCAGLDISFRVATLTQVFLFPYRRGSPIPFVQKVWDTRLREASTSCIGRGILSFD